MDSQEAAAADRRGPGVTNPTTEDAAKLTTDATSVKNAEPATKSPEAKDSTSKTDREKSHKKRTKPKAKKAKKPPVSEDDSSGSDSADADSSTPLTDSDGSDDSDDSESGVGRKKKKTGSKKIAESHKSKKKPKSKKPSKSSRAQIPASDSTDEVSDTLDDPDSDEDEDEEDDEGQLTKEELLRRLDAQTLMIQQLQANQLQPAQQSRQLYSYNNGGGNYLDSLHYNLPPGLNTQRSRRGNQLGRGLDSLKLDEQRQKLKQKQKQKQKLKQKAKLPGDRLDFKRVDQVWDNTIHNYKLQDTADTSSDSQYDEYLFHVRRTFDWEGKYKYTYVDIKSKLIRECLQEVIGNIKGVSLVEETPKLDPNLLFLYLEDFRKHLKLLKKAKPSGSSKKERKKDEKRNFTKRKQFKVLVKYIDHDYATVKKSLYPMLENGLITFDLIWALWKPNTLAYTTTYGSHDEPRVFKVEVTEKHYTIQKGDYYWIEGKYFEYDGKQFGYGTMSEEIADFQGARKITSLGCYPLKYHKNEAKIRGDLIERGKKFVRLSGVHYKNHQGMAYYKKKKAVVKININGRVMVDPAIHRRVNPNYIISLVRPKDHDVLSDFDDSDDDSDPCCFGTDSDEGGDSVSLESTRKTKYVTKMYTDKKGDVHIIRVPKDDLDEEQAEKLDKIPAKKKEEKEDAKEDDKSGTKDTTEKDADAQADEDGKAIPEFSDEEYLIASPVVLGFGFNEKMWLEFTVSGVKEIQWNEKAYDSLVLEPKTKDIVKALVESHKYHAAESIDDVIQGKGKGLVAVLHGPPGTGKTLTAEGISELLKCPLYMASAGELGTDSRYLEAELQKILDICHAWGAILLLDEADVFLEKRNIADIHRNALVSIFLRQLEYFQGILFLTTNRVETFDDAFQSRIHIALRYDNLDFKARKAIFKIFIERVRVLENIDLTPFSDQDLSDLAKNELNGRQIKNTVRTAQALAVNQKKPLSMQHIRQVLDVQNKFDRDLRGGQGYQEAMRSYF